jgi:hypothetical protein
LTSDCSVLNFAIARAQVAVTRDGDGIGMIIGWGGTLRSSATATRAAVAACAFVLVVSAQAQETPPPRPMFPIQAPSQAPGQPSSQAPSQVPSQPPAEPDSNPAFRPGFIDGFGRWLEEGASKFKSDMQGAQEKFDQFGGQARDAAKEATGAIIRLPNARPLTGRERCAPAQNGAPDCQAAALTFCRGKGFQTGKTLDTQSEQKCPTKLLLEGRAPNNTECPTEIFVTRAMCQ